MEIIKILFAGYISLQHHKTL